MGVVVLRDPFVVAVVCLHVVAVLFLDELAFHAEVGNDIIVSSVKNIIIDLVHPDVALLHLLLSYDAVAAGGHRVRRGERSAFRRNSFLRRIFSDGIRHRLARVNQRQIPVGIAVGIAALVHVLPVQTPRAQIDVVVELVITVFIVAADPDHVVIFQKVGIDDPVRMLQGHVCEPAALGHHRAVLAGSGFAQTDLCGGHGIGPCVVLVPKRDCASVVRTDVNIAADIPPVSFQALIVAITAAHLPPAVPLAVPPVEQRVAGRGHCVCSGRSRARVRRHRFRVRGIFTTERGRVNRNFAAFLAEELLEGCLDWTGRVLKQICCPNFQRCARSDVCKLAFNHGFKGVVVGKDGCSFQFYAVLHNCFIDAPKIRRILLAVVCEVQCQNDCVISVRIFHDARALVEQLIVTELDQIGVFRLILSAGGKAAEQHQCRKKQA